MSGSEPPPLIPPALRLPALGRWLMVVVAAVLVAGVVRAKHLHNRAQAEHAKLLPQRAQAHFDRYNQVRRTWAPVLDGLAGSSLERVRAAVDPDADPAARAARWSSEPDLFGGSLVHFRDPRTFRSFDMRFYADKLREAWIESAPYVDRPVRFWDAGEWLRKVVGIGAALVWVVAALGAYRERLIRRRLAPWALVAAGVALGAWALEPPSAIRDRDLRVPFGPFVGIALVVLTLPLFAMLLRRVPGAGHCLACGYDLTGNQSGVCPECGTPTPGEQRRRRHERLADAAAALEMPIPGGTGRT